MKPYHSRKYTYAGTYIHTYTLIYIHIYTFRDNTISAALEHNEKETRARQRNKKL
jgi:hypothetical protein